MKKLLVLTAIFTLFLTGCDDWIIPDDNYNNPINNNNEINADLIGKWSGTYVNSGEEALVTLDITKDSWVLVFYYDDGNTTSTKSTNGSCARDGSNLRLELNYSSAYGTASLSGDTLILNTNNIFASNSKEWHLTIQLKKGGSTGQPSTGGTSLKIQNESFSEITDVRWSNVTFTQGIESILNGKSVTKTVQEGDGYIFFKRKTNPINARTDQSWTIEKNEQKLVVINDNTIIVDVDNPTNKGTFGDLGVIREPQITLKVGDTPIAHFGDYNFGGVLLNTDRDVTFTIGNSGKADLKFNIVEGNVINLSNNISGYFSVVQQPFATMKIIPGGETTFIIRFSPKALGNNFNAEVTIATNSENNAQFTFRVKGNGSNEYSIGDTGPGGGMIFFAQGGQYKECSGELGTYNWSDAKSTAQNYKGGGLTDWHLPDNGELDLMYQNLHKKGLGGFLNTYYWSSTEDSTYTNEAWEQYFYNGAKYTSYKTEIDRVRAVRSFSL